MWLAVLWVTVITAPFAHGQTNPINGDFETGNSSGWTIRPATSARVVAVDVHGTGGTSRALEVTVPAFSVVLIEETNPPALRLGPTETSLSVRVDWDPTRGAMRPVRLAVAPVLFNLITVIDALRWHAEGSKQSKYGAFLGHPVDTFNFAPGSKWTYRLWVSNENQVPVTVFVDDLNLRVAQAPITREPWGTVDVTATRLPLRVEAARPYYMTLMFVSDRRVFPIQFPGYFGRLELDPANVILIGFGFGKIDQDLRLAPAPALRGRELWFQSIELDVHGTHRQFGWPRLGGFLK